MLSLMESNYEVNENGVFVSDGREHGEPGSGRDM